VQAVSESTAFCLASASKLVTSVAAIQRVERGLIGFGNDVSVHLPELKDAKILTGIEDRKPVLTKSAKYNHVEVSNLMRATVIDVNGTVIQPPSFAY
jgi:CubicO group peptidase (beta-lactamase class C family)